MRKIWIGLPAYNEEKAIGSLLTRFHEVLGKDFNYEIVVYNDGCKDRTVEIAESWKDRLNLTVIGLPTNRGLGEGLRRLVEFAVQNGGDEDLFALMDCDDTHHPSQIKEMIQVIDSGYDLVIASRYRARATVKGVPLHRQMLSFGAAFLFKTLHPVRGVLDYTCGYRCYKVS